ncbi:DUF4263 domain-containing protein [Mesorhizobium sp. M8A.F.Ca.ET.173.01.1.1]|nr:DUF4263 domain-containing protein [Mesorhizobium sp. M8A.F.Ca.ET.173.01.1.1]
MPLTQDDFDELAQLCNAANKNEVRCMELLASAPGYLVQGTIVSVNALTEIRSFFGDSDLTVTADIRDDGNSIRRKAYIWELKAPQCFIMEKDANNNRYRPSMDFIKAENQLIHYAYEAQGNRRFGERLEIMRQSDILIGGIIIGRTDRILRDAQSDGERERAWDSLNIRQRYLHDQHHIRVMTWDTVLELLRPT